MPHHNGSTLLVVKVQYEFVSLIKQFNLLRVAVGDEVTAKSLCEDSSVTLSSFFIKLMTSAYWQKNVEITRGPREKENMPNSTSAVDSYPLCVEYVPRR